MDVLNNQNEVKFAKPKEKNVFEDESFKNMFLTNQSQQLEYVPLNALIESQLHMEISNEDDETDSTLTDFLEIYL